MDFSGGMRLRIRRKISTTPSGERPNGKAVQ
jgi:hypothetical protein